MPFLDRLTLGKTGEDVACRELRRRGYEVLARRYRTRVGEIDIVAREGPTIVFIEVKTRTSATCGPPGEAVGPRKQRKIWLMASHFLLRRGWFDRPCRFDVVAITMRNGRVQRIEVFRGAFEGR
jgi:putative endonuclease